MKELKKETFKIIEAEYLVFMKFCVLIIKI
jgi:hypothetical protein